MRKLIQFRSKKNLDKGFTTLEVLISIFIALAFVSVTMQSFVLGLGIKVQAQEKQRANQLIQDDLEKLSDLASIISENHSNKCNPIATTSVPAVPATPSTPEIPAIAGSTAYENGYAKELWDDINAEAQPTAHLLKKSDGTNVGKKLGLIRSQINDLTDPSPVDDAPYRTLKINYQVRELDSSDNPIGDVIAERYVEVIPDVALRCP